MPTRESTCTSVQNGCQAVTVLTHLRFAEFGVEPFSRRVHARKDFQPRGLKKHAGEKCMPMQWRGPARCLPGCLATDSCRHGVFPRCPARSSTPDQIAPAKSPECPIAWPVDRD